MMRNVDVHEPVIDQSQVNLPCWLCILLMCFVVKKKKKQNRRAMANSSALPVDLRAFPINISCANFANETNFIYLTYSVYWYKLPIVHWSVKDGTASNNAVCFHLFERGPLKCMNKTTTTTTSRICVCVCVWEADKGSLIFLRNGRAWCSAIRENVIYFECKFSNKKFLSSFQSKDSTSFV